MNKVLFLTGYYGSGKSELAMNLALKYQVDTLVDLDIINPYFRTREMESFLREEGIEVISSDLEGQAHLDMPYISKKIYNPIHKQERVIYDLGGNDQGAKLMRQFEDYRDIDYDLWLVVNVYRQETDDAEKIMSLINRIEGTSGFKVTGLVNNSNMLKETTAEDIMTGQHILEEVSNKLGLPIALTTYWQGFKEDLNVSNETLEIKLFFRKNWF